MPPRRSRSSWTDSAYDAVYLAMAEAQGLRYVTADDRLARKVRDGKNRFQQILVLLAHTA